MGVLPRSLVMTFVIANPLYGGATISLYTVNATTGVRTSILATVYSGPLGTGTLTNPLTLDGEGKWLVPAYVEEAVVAVVENAKLVPDHETGVILGAAAVIDQTADVIINGGCQVAQRDAVSVSNSYLYGQVDRIAMKVDGTVTVGSIAQSTDGTLGTTGRSILLTPRITTADGAVYWRYRIEALDAYQFKDNAAVVHCQVRHSVTSAIDYTITVNRADDVAFAAVTLVKAGAAVSVATATNTALSMAIADMEDCSNGIEIIIKALCTAVDGPAFWLSDLKLELGGSITPFLARPYVDELMRCRRYAWSEQPASGKLFAIGQAVSATVAHVVAPLPTMMRAIPTLTFSAAAGFSLLDAAGAGIACTVLADEETSQNVLSVNTTVAAGLVAGNATQLVSGAGAAKITADAEL